MYIDRKRENDSTLRVPLKEKNEERLLEAILW